MAVAIATSTNGKYTTFSSTHATYATVLSEVLNELDTQNKSLTKTRFTVVSDGSTYSFTAICKN